MKDHRMKPAHLTVQGKPLCTCGWHLMHKAGVTCGHKSIADAKRAKASLQKIVWGVKVVPGPCPI